MFKLDVSKLLSCPQYKPYCVTLFLCTVLFCTSVCAVKHQSINQEKRNNHIYLPMKSTRFHVFPVGHNCVQHVVTQRRRAFTTHTHFIFISFEKLYRTDINTKVFMIMYSGQYSADRLTPNTG